MRATAAPVRVEPRVLQHICGVAVDLEISQLVDVPNMLVSAFLPEDIFVG